MLRHSLFNAGDPEGQKNAEVKFCWLYRIILDYEIKVTWKAVEEPHNTKGNKITNEIK